MTRRDFSRGFGFLSGSILLLWLSGCGVLRFDDGTLEGRRAAVEQVHRLLSSGQCEQAVAITTPLFESAQSDREIRMVHMAAKACAAGVSNLISLILALGNSSATLSAPGGLWVVATQLFYQSSPLVAESRLQSGLAAGDAGASILRSGITVAANHRLFFDSWNPGSTLPEDREEDANFYRIFLAFANLGNAQTRYGSPDPITFSNGATYVGATGANPFGWSLVSAVDDAACGYAASVVEFIDSIAASASLLPSSLSGTLATVATLYGSELDTACSRACQSLGSIVAHPVDYSGLGCPLVGNDRLMCTGIDANHPCLAALRNRKVCATRDADTVVDDQARCAAAGISHFISTHPALGWL